MDELTPNFSVAMSVYKNDNATFFDKALESITEGQTVKPTEIVLVVDGFIDDGLNAVIEKYSKKYDIFNIIRLPENLGLGNALKIAVENSKNELIARMDSDDIAVSTRFEEQLNCFKNDNSLDIVGGNISEFIGDENNIVAYRRVPISDSDIKQYLRIRCPFNHMTVMYKKSAVQKSGGYLDLFWNEDYYLWIRMFLNNAKFANTGTTLVNVRTGSDMYSRRGGKCYFKSEVYLQNFMLKNKIINIFTYFTNIIKRFIVQLVLPNNVRGMVFRTFARNN